MSIRTIAFWVGLISLVMGLLTYDKEVATAVVPIITGALVLLLAAFNLIPEFKPCQSCGKKIPKKQSTCRFCGADQDAE